MKILQATKLVTILLACLFCATDALQAKDRHADKANIEMKQAALDFLASLDEKLRDQVTFEFKGSERTDWHFIPKERVGVSFKEMALEQRRAAHILMRSVLSDQGYLKSVAIMSLEQVLRELEANRENVNNIRDPEKYWFAIFGDPAAKEPWGWRVEGHHLSLNFTSVDGLVAGVTPIFMGANPAEIRVGSQVGTRVLGAEEDRARALMAAFTPEQRKQAIIAADAPADVLTTPGKPIDIGKPTGIAAGDMKKSQRAKLHQMAASFLRNLRPGLARQELKEIEKAGIENIYFAWAGSVDPEEKHYFRVHGPTFIMEYDNSQGNHAHVVWHSSGNDFGAAVLHRHYQESPHHHGSK